MNNSKKIRLKVLRFFKQLGPGLITVACDDDPSGIATYSQSGAAYGLSPLWTALLTFPLMAAIQGMCTRIGMVTQKGLTGIIKEHYSKPVLYLMALFSFQAIVMNIGADIAGIWAVGNLLFPSIGLSLEYIGITPIHALINSAILYGLIAPVLIAIILHIANKKNNGIKHK